MNECVLVTNGVTCLGYSAADNVCLMVVDACESAITVTLHGMAPTDHGFGFPHDIYTISTSGGFHV